MPLTRRSFMQLAIQGLAASIAVVNMQLMTRVADAEDPVTRLWFNEQGVRLGLDQLRGQSYTGVWFNETTEFTEEKWLSLAAYGSYTEYVPEEPKT